MNSVLHDIQSSRTTPPPHTPSSIPRWAYAFRDLERGERERFGSVLSFPRYRNKLSPGGGEREGRVSGSGSKSLFQLISIPTSLIAGCVVRLLERVAILGYRILLFSFGSSHSRVPFACTTVTTRRKNHHHHHHHHQHHHPTHPSVHPSTCERRYVSAYH